MARVWSSQHAYIIFGTYPTVQQPAISTSNICIAKAHTVIIVAAMMCGIIISISIIIIIIISIPIMNSICMNSTNINDRIITCIISIFQLILYYWYYY